MLGRSAQSWPCYLSCLLMAGVCSAALAVADTDKAASAADVVGNLEKPLYNPFVERYVLDELKHLRVDLSAQRAELIQQIVDRELESVDRGVTYATNTVTYFFYLIAASSSVLVLVGWRSIADIKDRVRTLADEEINKLVQEYEERLRAIEQQLNQRTRNIEKNLVENREEIELTRDMQSLWLRAGQESSPQDKIQIYDQILLLDKDDCEALTYKADAALELQEPQWAANLCHQALVIDPENGHAFYQLGCAYTLMGQMDEAMDYINKAITRSENYLEKIAGDPALEPLRRYEPFQEFIKVSTGTS